MKIKSYINPNGVDSKSCMRRSPLNTCSINAPLINLVSKINLESKSKHSGFSLIEVMISAFVLSISLLGILGMQVYSMKGTQHSYMKQQAMGIVQNMMERMAANRPGVVARDYVFDTNDTSTLNCSNPTPDCSGAKCSVSDIAKVDKMNIACGYKAGGGSRTAGIKVDNADDIVSLVGGRLQVSCRTIAGIADCEKGDVTVTVNWIERDLTETKGAPTEDFLSLNLRIAPP